MHPQGFAPTFVPTLGLLHPNFRLWGFVEVGPEVWAFVYQYKQFLTLLKFHYNSENWGLTMPLGFICCSETLYIIKENYSNLDRTKAKIIRMIFLIKGTSRMRNILIIRNFILGV